MNPDAIKTGGPAFPCDNIIQRDEKGHCFGREISSAGMSLRDHFAGLAMQGLLSSNALYSGKADRDQLSADAYSHADAMIKAREAI